MRVRSRGQAYFARGFVKIVEGTRQVVQAVVHGTAKYDVSLRIEGPDLLVGCSCPYYDKDLCKHVWATMLAAQRNGYLTGTGQAPTRLVAALLTESDDEEEGYEDVSKTRYDGVATQ